MKLDADNASWTDKIIVCNWTKEGVAVVRLKELGILLQWLLLPLQCAMLVQFF